MKLTHFLVLCACIAIAICGGDEEAQEELRRRRIIDQLTRTRTEVLEDYNLVSRQVLTDVFMFRSYRTVSVIFYSITNEVSKAHFTFHPEELHLNNIGSCEPSKLTVQLKRGSYAAVNPDGYKFPRYFIDPDWRDQHYTIPLVSGVNTSFTLDYPTPGNWYGLLYINWEDPRTAKVQQQGLVADCHTVLYTDLQIQKEIDVRTIDCNSGIKVNYSDIPAIFKCLSPDSVDPIDLKISITNVPENYNHVWFKFNPESIPFENETVLECSFDPKETTDQTLVLAPHPGSWLYMRLLFDLNPNMSLSYQCEKHYLRSIEEDVDSHTVVDLMRDDKGRFFTFDYGFPTSTDLQDVNGVLNLTSGQVQSVRFKINQFIDIGGNLIIETALGMSMKYYMGYTRKPEKDGTYVFTDQDPFFKVVVCLSNGYASIPSADGICYYNKQFKDALIVLNSTDSDTIHGRFIIPYPESGTWYLTYRLFCDSTVCPCNTSNNGSTYYVKGNVRSDSNVSGDLNKMVSKDDKSIYGSDLEVNNSIWEGGTVCNATVLFTVSSSSCIGGTCSNYGSCMLNTFGGLVMSFCSCPTGYGGWDCSDSSRINSISYMMLSILLLTLSNILFFFSIYVATIRLYYTEAMMYGFTMVFSSFYHACDAPTEVAYCITRGNILQFGDFYCGIMSFWVTLLAMSLIGERLRSTLHLIGAMVVAILTTWNMHSFLAFCLPVTVGVAVLLLSWVLDWRFRRAFCYPRSYYTKHMPFGLSLVTVGLICYAFLQTEQNYKIVHSFWHMIIAVSVIFLLPDVKRGDNVHPFAPSKNFLGQVFCKMFKRRLSTAPANQVLTN